MRHRRGLRMVSIAALAAVSLVVRTGAQQTGGVANSRRDPVPATTGGTGAEWLELAIDRLLANRHFPPVESTAPATPDPDAVLLELGLGQPYPNVRAAAVRGVGRLEDPDSVKRLIPFLQDPDSNVRLEAANAIAVSLRRAQPAAAEAAMQALLARIPVGRFAEPSVYDALSRLPYATADADKIEKVLYDAETVSDIDTDAYFVNLFTRDRRRPPAAATRALLEKRARIMKIGVAPGPSLDAWRALQILGEVDQSLLSFGATYHCPSSPAICGWQIRQIALEMINPADPVFASDIEQGRHDVSVIVRLTALRTMARGITTTKKCAPVLETARDGNESTIFHLEALSRLDPRCEDRDDVVTYLKAEAGLLSDPDHRLAWHEPARALEVLAKFDVEAATPMAEVALEHPVWQARMAAARAAVTAKDEPLMLKFAEDKDANVQNEAIAGLSALASAHTTELSIKALASADYQVVRTAAENLKKRPPSEDEIKPLLASFDRITAEGKDTSHDPRASILQRLKTLAQQRNVGGDSWLLPYVNDRLPPALADFDPDIAKLAAGVIGAVTGVEPVPHPKRRPPVQPTEAEMRRLPKQAIIKLDTNEEIEINFLTAEAPVAIVRFVKLAQSKYYDGLTFHRVEPLFVIQGGSPGANEYAGAPRFMRDEIGVEHHIVGTVGLSTRGRDTADAQIFVDLTNQYRLDYLYTIIGRVTKESSLDTCERLLEGARISSVHIVY